MRFEPRTNRGISPSLVFYGVLPGANKDYFPSCQPPNAQPYTYTPTAADIGPVTVSELANVRCGTAPCPEYFIRNFQVYGTPPPVFTIAPCPNGLVSITITDAVYDSYAVQVGSGTGSGTAVPRNQATTLAVPGGATTVTVTGRYAANGLCEGTSTQPIPALAAPQMPLFTTLTLQGPLPGGAATLAVGQLPAGYLYTLQLDNGSGFRRVADVPAGSTSIALPTPAAGCYRLSRTDACGNSPAVSTTICTLSLSGASAQNRNQLLLSDAGSPGTTYTVLRNTVPLATVTPIPGGLEDAAVQCGTTYTYVVRATQPGGTAISNEVAIRTQSSLAPVAPGLVASITPRNEVELTPLLAAPLTAGSSLRYQRTASGQAPADFGTTTTADVRRDTTPLADLLAAPPCYSVRLTDVCGNVSAEGPAACPALLSASAADPDGTTATLAWTPFAGPGPAVPVTYTLQRLAADGTVRSTATVSGTRYVDLTPPTDLQVVRYRLQISGGGLPPGTFSYSNVATLTRQLFLSIPTAFTPNGDGRNDVLEVKGKYLSNYTFVVVDRNGQEVFRGTQRSETWDGRINGHEPVLGGYVWRFQQDQEGGKPFTATGSVTILK